MGVGEESGHLESLEFCEAAGDEIERIKLMGTEEERARYSTQNPVPADSFST